jgi:uncharacterized protein (TIGR03435 family)
MNQQLGTRLTVAGKLLLASLATAALAAPLAIGILHPSQLPAQEQQLAKVVPDTPVIESVSIKASTGAEGDSRIEFRPGALIQTNAPLKTLIAMAYGVQEYQITNEPAWVDSDHFDIEAHWKDARGATTAMLGAPLPPPPPPTGSSHIVIDSIAQPGSDMPGPVGVGQLHLALRAILADKFKLKLYDTAQQLPVYELVVADAGAKLTPTQPSQPGTATSKSFFKIGIGDTNGQTEFTLNNVSSVVFANQLSQQLHRQVIDKTGLTGHYDMDIHWPTDQEGFDPISAALEDQVGLKLKPSQAPVAVIQITQVEKPSEN